jgi:hypothetical protein
MPVTRPVANLAAGPAPAPIRAAMLIDASASPQRGGQPEIQNVIITPHTDTARVDSESASGPASTKSAHHNAGLAARWPNEWTLKDWEQRSAHPLALASADVVASQASLVLVGGTIVTAGIVAGMVLIRRRRELLDRIYAAPRSWSQDQSILPILARLSAAEASGAAEPWTFYHAIAAGVPAANLQREDIPSAPEHGNIDLQYSPDLPQSTDEIDLLLEELEALTQRPAA